MMTDLEEAILAQVRELAPQQQAEVLAFAQTLKVSSFDYKAWRETIKQIHAELRAEHGDDYHIDMQSLLDEVREEASNSKS
jgi:hypothetical protein